MIHHDPAHRFFDKPIALTGIDLPQPGLMQLADCGLILKTFDASLQLIAGKCRGGEPDGRDRRGHNSAASQERPARGGLALAHVVPPHVLIWKYSSTSNLPACPTTAPILLMLRPPRAPQ